jgi:hypothetical protein
MALGDGFPADGMRRSIVMAPAETVTVAFTLACARAGELAFVVGVAPGSRHI